MGVHLCVHRHSDICSEQFCLSDHTFGGGRWFDRKGDGVESNGQTNDQPTGEADELARHKWEVWLRVACHPRCCPE